MLQTSARLLRLLSLFQAQRYWSGADLCDRLEVTARTLRRDVDRLRSLGYPVHSTTGAAGGYQLGAGAKLPPLQLDDDEAVAVAVGLRTAGATVSGIEEASVRALAKLEQVLPARLRSRVEALHAFIVPLESAGPTVAAGRLSAIAAACRDHVELSFRYQSREGADSERTVEPHRLVHTGRRWYLAAWDAGRKNWRTFRVDRIASDPTPGRRFLARQPPGNDFAAFVGKSVTYQPYPFRASVTVFASVSMVADRIPPAAGTLEAIDDGTCVLHTGSHSPEILARYLGLIGVDFAVSEPPELVEELRRLSERYLRAVDENRLRRSEYDT
jgi:predicted DNA-binding transcriptional regulator YafY